MAWFWWLLGVVVLILWIAAIVDIVSGAASGRAARPRRGCSS